MCGLAPSASNHVPDNASLIAPPRHGASIAPPSCHLQPQRSPLYPLAHRQAWREPLGHMPTCTRTYALAHTVTACFCPTRLAFRITTSGNQTCSHYLGPDSMPGCPGRLRSNTAGASCRSNAHEMSLTVHWSGPWVEKETALCASTHRCPNGLLKRFR
jgi:hypothetical protein